LLRDRSVDLPNASSLYVDLPNASSVYAEGSCGRAVPSSSRP
jgi:hypothetical protein